jgi:tape measure domain-containing protein
MVTENVDIRFRESGARVIKRKIDDIGKAANTATRGIFLLQRALFVLGGAGILRGLTRAFDTLTEFENRLKLTATSASNLEAVQSSLFDVANRSRTAFEGVAEVYTRAALSSRRLGTSQEELIAFTERLSKATIISGASAREANAALIQLGQGLASNTLRGDELRSVLEQLPFVADVIAEELTRSGKFGEVGRGELRELAEDGKISAEVIFDAFKTAGDKIDEAFEKTLATVSQSFTILRNNFLEFVDQFDDATGISNKLAEAIIRIGENIDTIIILGGSLATALLGSFALGPINKFIRALKIRSIAETRLNNILVIRAQRQKQLRAAELAGIVSTQKNLRARKALLATDIARLRQDRKFFEFTRNGNRVRNIATGQFVALEVAKANLLRAETRLAAAEATAATRVRVLNKLRAEQTIAATTLAAAEDRLTAAQLRQNTTLAKLNRNFPLLSGIVRGIKTLFIGLFAIIAANPITALIAVVLAATLAFIRWGNEIKVTEDKVVGLRDFVVAAFQIMNEAINDFVDEYKDAFDGLGEFITSQFDGVIPGIKFFFLEIAAIQKSIANFILNSYIALFKAVILIWDKFPTRFESIGKLAANLFIDAFESVLNFVDEVVDLPLKITDAILKATGKEPIFEEFLKTPDVDLSDFKFDLEDEVIDLKNDLKEIFSTQFSEDLIGDGLDGILAQLDAAFNAIVKRARENIAAAKRDALTSGDRTGGEGGVDGNAQDFAELLANLDQEKQALQRLNPEREIYNRLQSIDKDIKGGLTGAQKLLVLNILLEIQALEDEMDILEDIVGPRRQAQRDLEALNRLYEKGKISIDDYNISLRELQQNSDQAADTLFGGFRSAISASIKTAEEMGDAIGNIVVDAVKGLTDAFVEFAKTGKLSIEDVFASLFEQLFRLAANQLFLSLLGSVFGVVGLGGLTGGGGALGILGFASGGTILPSSNGTTDSQIVTFAKRPDERVDILTPFQQRQQQESITGGGDSDRNQSSPGVTIVNVDDPKKLEDFLLSPDGESAVLNILSKNPSFIRRTVQFGG